MRAEEHHTATKKTPCISNMSFQIVNDSAVSQIKRDGYQQVAQNEDKNSIITRFTQDLTLIVVAIDKVTYLISTIQKNQLLNSKLYSFKSESRVDRDQIVEQLSHFFSLPQRTPTQAESEESQQSLRDIPKFDDELELRSKKILPPNPRTELPSIGSDDISTTSKNPTLRPFIDPIGESKNNGMYLSPEHPLFTQRGRDDDPRRLGIRYDDPLTGDDLDTIGMGLPGRVGLPGSGGNGKRFNGNNGFPGAGTGGLGGFNGGFSGGFNGGFI